MNPSPALQRPAAEELQVPIVFSLLLGAREPNDRAGTQEFRREQDLCCALRNGDVSRAFLG